MKATPILAEDYREFRRFVNNQNLNVGHFAYVDSSFSLRGYRGLVISVGRYWRNPNYTADFFSQLESKSRFGEVSVVKGVWDNGIVNLD